MPDQLAHILFARRVLAACSSPLRSRICAESAAFRAGTFGPDPLFNDPSPRRRAEGFELHRMPGRVSLERMREPVRTGMPWAADYAAGFFCHYALDRLCHPELKALAAQEKVNHIIVESAYDRMLLLRGEGDLPRKIVLSPTALQAAAVMYHRLTPRQYRMDLNAFWRIRRTLAAWGGTPVADVVGKLYPAWNEMIPRRIFSPAVAGGVLMLEKRLNASVDIAAQQLERYFAAMDSGAPLDPWVNADFAGGKHNCD